MNPQMLLYVGQLLECLIAESARVLPNIRVDKRMLCQLLRRGERLETFDAFVSLVLHSVNLLGMSLHVRLVDKFLSKFKQLKLGLS